MRVLLCGYRDWALVAFAGLQEYAVFHHDTQFQLVSSPEELDSAMEAGRFDVAFVIGWSWKVAPGHLSTIPFVGMHPSALPAYAGGSPIQNQILDGLKTSKATLFRFLPEMDAGPILAQREFSLEGHLNEVLQRLSAASFIMFAELLDAWPDVTERPQVGQRDVRRRIKPEASRLDKEQLSQMSCRQLWDAIRCREDPYPNVFMEDDTGKLVIKRVEFEPK